MGIPEISCDPSSAHDAKWMVSSVVLLPESLMVLRDHGTFGSMAAFFKESMRRDAIIGTKTVFTLGTQVNINNSTLTSVSKEKTYTPGMN